MTRVTGLRKREEKGTSLHPPILTTVGDGGKAPFPLPEERL